MAFELILTEKKEGAGIITLNRPAKLNAFNHAMIQEIHAALTQFEDDDDVKVLIMTGAGEKAFCAGADIHEEAEISKEQNITQEDLNRWRGNVDNNWHIANYKKPTICALNGLAYGGGSNIAMSFDIRIGCERSAFRVLGVKVGIVFGTWTLPSIVGWPMAKEILYSGRVVPAEEAYRIGLLNHLVPAADVMKYSLDLAKEIAGNYQPAVRALKDILDHNIGLERSAMRENERQTVARAVPIPNPKDSFSQFLKSHEKK